ncbi:FAD dependent oxidoreductase [Novosphingobium resinovorum]|uniref:Pyridine nucleotide-disulfide oxidoreductase domain-containing protein 2 n=1 Tax=Novosphingobium resinovorum TaxID=158500 RepID=A0A031JRP3_9SPHN|nr:NAD(P)/FAD-dependent oxidoreductase [Novosphingobium resinovorum]EZP78271.1 FAD dependent oxidoreductase [Novosphingobium resinovorum]
MKTNWDAIVVGSGINSLVCAAQLTAKGRRVLVLERAAVAGGCIRTEEATVPGFRHDLFSMSYPLFVTTPFYPQLAPKLEAHGVRMVQAEIPTGVLLPDGRSLLLRQSREANVAAFDAAHPGDGAAHARAMAGVEEQAPLLFGLLGNEPRSFDTASLLGRTLLKQGIDQVSAFGADSLKSARDWLEARFGSDLVHALIAPWVLHVGLGPESAASAMMARVVMFTLEAAGLPFVEGGSDRIVAGFRAIIEGGGGALLTDADVEQITVERGRATGVRLADGRTFTARRGVACNVTPTQLYQRLLPAEHVPPATAERAADYRYGRACMQIHIALSEPPAWVDPELGKVGLLHLTPGMDGVSRAVNEADRGLLPAEATIVVGQPAHADPSRCPPGTSMLWIQLQELPRTIRGDAAGEIAVPADGRWNDDVAQAYARRIIARITAHVPNLERATLGMRVLGPHDLEAANINLVGGDPYSGVCSIDQFHLFRPFAGTRNHATPVKRLFHIGASTHPGPGLGGVSGYHAAMEIG